MLIHLIILILPICANSEPRFYLTLTHIVVSIWE
jgi:hypothetical protein